MLYALIDCPSLKFCSNYSFQKPCHFRLLVHSKIRYYCLHNFFVLECIQNHKAITLYAWIDRLSTGVCSNYSFGNLCHFRLIVHSETRCYCLHAFFVWECIQNNKALMLYTGIDCWSLGIFSNNSFQNLCHL